MEEAYTPPVLPSVPQPQTSYGYDLDRNLTSVLHPGGGSVAYTLDPDSGQLDPLVLQPENETRGYIYDATSGYTASVSTPDALLSFGYDGDLLTSETWSFAAPAVTHTVTHGYDNDFRRQSIQVDTLPAVSFLYDDDGLLIAAGDLTLERDAGNGLLRGTTLVGGVTITDTYTPSPFGEVDAYSAAVDGTPIYGYTIDQRDKLGRIVRKTETIEGVETQYEYGYDPAGRLADVWRLSPFSTHLAHYEYDANGNRIGGFNQVSGAIVPASGTEDGTHYDDQDRLMRYETAEDGVVAYGYTAAGALLSKADLGGTTTYDYDAFGNLRTAELPGGTTLAYLVDARNRRIGKRVNNGVQDQFVQGFLYQDQLEPVAELGPDGSVVAQFVYASKPHVPDYMIKYGVAAGVYRILSDHLGSPRLVVELANGAIAHRIDYDEFGYVLADSEMGFQPFGFAGGLWDTPGSATPGSGRLRFGARDYDPLLGRWTTKDPIRFNSRDTNLYAYSPGDPINWLDRNGKGPISAVGVASFCAGYEIGDTVNRLNDPVLLQESIALVQDQINRINERLESIKCDAADRARLLSERAKLVGVATELAAAAATNSGSVFDDLTAEIVCGIVAAGSFLAPIP